MAAERRTRAWWLGQVARWRRSGQTADDFAAGAGLKTSTLRWWSSRANSGTRAPHGSTVEAVPIEIEVSDVAAPTARSVIEITVGRVVLRCEVGTAPAYLVELLRALAAEV